MIKDYDRAARECVPSHLVESRLMGQAGARTPSGNLDVPEPSANTSDLDLTLSVNSNELVWTIPYYHSSSCSDRSGIACYNIRHQ